MLLVLVKGDLAVVVRNRLFVDGNPLSELADVRLEAFPTHGIRFERGDTRIRERQRKIGDRCADVRA